MRAVFDLFRMVGEVWLEGIQMLIRAAQGKQQ